MARLTRGNLSSLTRKTEILELGNDTQIKIQEMSLQQQLDSETTHEDSKLFVYTMLINCCLDDDDQPIFVSPDDVKNLPSDMTIKIFKACLKINNLVSGDLESMAKN